MAKPDKPDISGMTVNERLVIAGLIDNFDAAVMRRDRAKMIEILQQVELNDTQSRDTSDAIMEDPFRYGFQPGIVSDKAD